MPEKKEGATMTCKGCGTELTCRSKDYGGNFAATLQWQNQDGSAHYKTTNGKDFTCNIPEGEESTTPSTTSKDLNSFSPSLDEKFEHINHELESIKEMTASMFNILVDIQLGKIKVVVKTSRDVISEIVKKDVNQ